MYLETLLQDHIVYALVWMIMHSIWQFALIAVVMSILLHRFRHNVAGFRYNVALGSLGLSLMAGIYTFMHYLDGDSTYLTSKERVFLANLDIHADGQDSNFDFFRLIVENQNTIFYAWVIGLLIFALKFIVGLGYIHFLATSAKIIPIQSVNDKFEALKKTFNIQKSLSLKESRFVNSPMILSIIKPVILMPVGVVNRLDIQEVEAILVHEIAHFMRYDLHINIIQTIIESIFYYHPAIWWISANIRVERENCCDDVAITYLGNNVLYAKTLVKMQEINTNYFTSLALNFNNRNSFFSNRIKRILKMTQTRNFLREKVLTSLLLAFMVFIFSKNLNGSAIEPNDHDFKINMEDPLSQRLISTMDSLPKRKEKMTIQRKSDKEDVKISVEDGKITNLEIDGKKIEEKDYNKYDGIINDIKPKSSTDKDLNYFYFGDGGQKGVFKFDFDHNMDSLFGGMENLKNFKGFDFSKLENLQKLNNGDLQEKLKMLQGQLGSMKFNLDSLGLGELGINDQMQDGFNDIRMFKFDEDGNNFEFRYPKDREQEIEDEVRIGRGSNFTEVIGNALNKDGFLIPNQENKVELTGKHLKINGEKQPSNIWQKYKRIFEEQSGTTLNKDSKIQFQYLGKESKRKYRSY